MDTVTEFTEVKSARKYHRRTVDEKRRIVEETLSGKRSVAEIARRHEVNENQLFDWRKQYLEGRLGVNDRECALLPITLNEASDSDSDSGAAQQAASTPLTQGLGTDPDPVATRRDTRGRGRRSRHAARCDPVP